MAPLLDPVMAGLRTEPVAWRCENCKRWQPRSMAAKVLIVDEVAAKWSVVGAVAQHGRFARRMVVCPPCERSIAGNEGTQQ
jgi:hypothetical protein